MEYVIDDYSTYPKYSYADRNAYFGFSAAIFKTKKMYEQNLTIGLLKEAKIPKPLEQGISFVTDKVNVSGIKIFKSIRVALVIGISTAIVYVAHNLIKR